ncbi:MAG: response regulator transcription factor [Nonlabens sp.]
MIQVLVTEDHQSLIDGIKLLLKNDPDIEIIGTANDGKELLEILEHKKAHLVLTDINMPRMNGVELCTEIKKKYPHIKVVAYTMFESVQAVRDMMDACADGYILKKRPLKEVRDAILKVAQGEKYYDPSLDVNSDTSTTATNVTSLLSKTEIAILKLIAQNKTSSEIAEIRHTAVSTVFTHRKNMIKKLNLSGSGELMRYALSRYKHYN